MMLDLLSPLRALIHAQGTAVEALFGTWTLDSMPDDLSGRTYVVVGSTSGLGLQAAKELARKKAHVVVTARNAKRGESALQSIREDLGDAADLTLMMVDVSDFGSVQRFAEEFKAKGFPLHGLINNAGIFLPEHQITPDGFEITLKTNHFGLFFLSMLLLNELKKSAPSRMVWVSSPAEALGSIKWSDLKGATDTASDINMYARTKLMNIMTSNEFQRRLAGTGVESFACHPGIAESGIYSKMDTSVKWSARGMDILQSVVRQSEQRGALSLLYCATEPGLSGKGGKYYGPNKINLWNTAERGTVRRSPWDPAACSRLFDESKRILEECIGRPLPDV